MRAAIAQPIGRQARRSIARCDKKGEPENRPLIGSDPATVPAKHDEGDW
jgi:hypothetical protein